MISTVYIHISIYLYIYISAYMHVYVISFVTNLMADAFRTSRGTPRSSKWPKSWEPQSLGRHWLKSGGARSHGSLWSTCT